MPPPRVNYKDLPKAARDQIDKDHGQKTPTLSKKEREEIRIKQVVDNIKDKQRAEERGTTAKDFREMKKRQDSERKEKEKSPVVSKTEKAKNWLKDRSAAIAQNTQDIRPRGRGGNVFGAMSMGMPANPDLFGVGGFGGGGGMHGMMGADPFHEFSPRRNPQPAPQRKKKRKGKRRAPAAPRSPSMGMMGGGIPSHMKWMFGQ
jgi:hypothetical protein